jgi:hypothetical protein
MNYDTKESIAAQLESYATFYALMSLRREHGSQPFGSPRVELSPLSSFVILGRYISDELGQCHRLSRTTFTDADRAALAPVMTEQEFLTFVETHVVPRITQSYFVLREGISGMSPSFPLPPPQVVCARCGGTWELNSCHDIDSEGDFEDVNLSDFVGKTLEEVGQDFATRTDASRAFGYPRRVQNIRWADLNVRDEHASPEELGWRDVTSDYVVAAGDQTSVFRYRFYHGECFRALNSERLAAKEAADLEALRETFEFTGFEDVKVTRTSLPDHMRKWVAEGLDEEDLDKLLKVLAYFRVETNHGSFGIMLAAYPVLDLEGSGVTPKDLDPRLAASVPPESPQIIGFSGEPEQLLMLRQHLMKSKANK